MTIPLDLFHEVTTADGTRYRWDANQPAGSRLRNFGFGTKIGEGFSDGSGQLARLIDGDYPDLELVNDFRSVGADGSIAYEGRFAALPRDLGDTHTINVTIAGWMAHAKDRKFKERYCDRDVSQFTEEPIERRQGLSGSSIDYATMTTSSDLGGLTIGVPGGAAIPTNSVKELWMDAGPGMTIAKVAYRAKEMGNLTNFEPRTLYGSDSPATSLTGYALTVDDALHTIPLSPAQRWLVVRLLMGTGTTQPASGSTLTFSKLAMYGPHGLALHTGDPNEPAAPYLSDIMRDIARRFCPQLDPSGIQDNPYVVQHCAYTQRTAPYDAFLDLNKYALWHLGVWENKRLDFRPYNFADYDWEIRTDDPGTTFSPNGPSTEDLFNGIVVTYTDPLTGRVDELTPDVHPELADTSVTNPWNRQGIQHWDEITLSSPCFAAVALQLGRIALADRLRPRTPGTINVTAYVRDRAGVLQPAYKVRAGDTIKVTNFPNDTPRLIVETRYDDEAKRNQLSIDQTFALLDAYLDRQANALTAAGLA